MNRTEPTSDMEMFRELSEKAKKVNPKNPEHRQRFDKCVRELDVLLSGDDPPKGSELFPALQKLPEWLRTRAVSNRHIQVELNRESARRFPTATLIMDLYVQISLVWAFSSATHESIDARALRLSGDLAVGGRVGGWYIWVLYFGVIYFGFRELSQMSSMIMIGALDLWLYDPWNVLDVVYIGLLVVSTVSMQSGMLDDETFRIVVMVTGGLLWAAIMALLKSINLHFAVFVSGVLHVTWTLRPFLLMMGLILGSFAQMYFAIYYKSERCKAMDEDPDNLSRYGSCSLSTSFVKMYQQFVNGEISEDDLTYVPTTMILSIIFAFLVIILLLNVLIAIVTDSYVDVKNRGQAVFWSHRLNFVAEMEAVRDFVVCYSGGSKFKARKDAFNGRNYWKSLTSVYNEIHLHDVNHDDALWLYAQVWPQRLFATVIIVLWVLFGVVTFGTLWPAQVREFFLCPTVTAGDNFARSSTSMDMTKAVTYRDQQALRDEMVSRFVNIERQCHEMQVQMANSNNDNGRILAYLLEMDAKITDVNTKMNAIMH